MVVSIDNARSAAVVEDRGVGDRCGEGVPRFQRGPWRLGLGNSEMVELKGPVDARWWEHDTFPVELSGKKMVQKEGVKLSRERRWLAAEIPVLADYSGFAVIARHGQRPSPPSLVILLVSEFVGILDARI